MPKEDDNTPAPKSLDRNAFEREVTTDLGRRDADKTKGLAPTRAF